MIPVSAAVLGVGLWTPRFPDPQSWRRGQAVADEAAATPPARLPPKLRRRTSLLIRMVAEVAAQAVEQAGVSPQDIPIVVGSAFGELGTTIEMLDEMEADGALSPMRFHNSVHNSAAGYLSIAHGNRRPATSLAAGNETVAMVLLEALGLLADRGGDVLAIIADEALPLQLVPTIGTGAVSAALVLRAAPGGATAFAGVPSSQRTLIGPQALALIGDIRQAADPTPAAARTVEVASPSAAILPVIAAIMDAAGQAAASPAVRIELAPAGGPPRWSIAVEGVGRAGGERT